MSTFDVEDDYRELVLFACTACDRCYVMNVADRKVQCPISAGHGYLAVVNAKSGFIDYVTCANPECTKVLHLSLHFDGDKCEHCKKRSGIALRTLVKSDGELLDDTDIAGLVVQEEVEVKGSKDARRLEAAIKERSTFETSHHKGTKGRHTHSQTATHDKGDKEDAQKRKQMREELEELITKLESSPNYDPATHDGIIKRARDLLNSKF